MMASTKVQLAVQMTCQKCVSQISEKLSGVEGVHNFNVSLDAGEVVVETSLPSSEIQQLIESTGRRAVIKGYGEDGHLGAAVAMLGGTIGFGHGNVQGVVRFVQKDDSTCIVDGTVDGLQPGLHGLHIHECGDLSQGCKSVGEHYNPRKTRHGSPANDEDSRHVGDLGNIVAEENGRATFRISEKLVKVWDIIGRSVVVTEKADDFGEGHHPESLVSGNSGQRLACGIIARSAGLFENPKKICDCDGVSLWDERDVPLAGPGRQNKQNDDTEDIGDVVDICQLPPEETADLTDEEKIDDNVLEEVVPSDVCAELVITTNVEQSTPESLQPTTSRKAKGASSKQVIGAICNWWLW